MTMARSQLVDVSVTRWYHCITRCVRRAFLLAEGPLDRRERIELRMKELANIVAVAGGGFSVMNNHLHVLGARHPISVGVWIPLRENDPRIARSLCRNLDPAAPGGDQVHAGATHWLSVMMGWDSPGFEAAAHEAGDDAVGQNRDRDPVDEFNCFSKHHVDCELSSRVDEWGSPGRI
jgi:hypothetical protein